MQCVVEAYERTLGKEHPEAFEPIRFLAHLYREEDQDQEAFELTGRTTCEDPSHTLCYTKIYL